MPAVARDLDRQCIGGHEHQEVMGSAGGMKRSTWSQIYTESLSKAAMRGLSQFRVKEPTEDVFGVEDEEPGSELAEDGEGHEESAEPVRVGRNALYHGRPQGLESSIRRLHVNLGHASNAIMLRYLRHANATQEALRRAAEFMCWECEVKTDPKAVRPAALNIAQPVLRFIGLDVKELPG